MKHIFNFIKFGIIITILEFINEFVVGSFDFLSYETDIILRYSLLGIILIFIAFNRKYIVFKKDDWKQNLISIIFIICSSLWFYLVCCITVAFLLGWTLYYHGF